MESPKREGGSKANTFLMFLGNSYSLSGYHLSQHLGVALQASVRGRAFSIVAPALWNELLGEVRGALPLLGDFQEGFQGLFFFRGGCFELEDMF